MSLKKGLGRGLDALIPEDMSTNSGKKAVQEINIDLIRPCPSQARTDFKKEAIASLALSIKEHGMLQPVLVREMTDGYELIAGERRFRACQTAGLKKINAIVKHFDDSEAAVVSLPEQRPVRQKANNLSITVKKKKSCKIYCRQK
ncbi:MAG: putative transcriptional regulator [Desulfotomaculum sp. 46_296]|nr:MAG: putative transcriptional regulator [Desulfotomaculum sp. 46_296]